ncbi:MAG: hypothetical protein AB8I08_13350 [Sandaracinaceae bacterium]
MTPASSPGVPASGSKPASNVGGTTPGPRTATLPDGAGSVLGDVRELRHPITKTTANKAHDTRWNIALTLSAPPLPVKHEPQLRG